MLQGLEGIIFLIVAMSLILCHKYIKSLIVDRNIAIKELHYAMSEARRVNNKHMAKVGFLEAQNKEYLNKIKQLEEELKNV